MCEVLEICRSSYYAWLKRPISAREAENTTLIEKLKFKHEESKKRYGAPRLTAELRAEGYNVSRKRVAHLMRKEGIFGCARRKFRVMNTTDSNHNLPISPRFFQVENEETHPEAPNQVWVGDTTYIGTREGWLYLTVVLDVFNRKIVGFAIADHLRTEPVWEAMRNGILNEKEALIPGARPLIAHSDRGSQYASHYYREKLELFGITQSMSRRGNCYDNAYAETFFHSLKVELVHRQEFQTHADAQKAIAEYIEWYNYKRLHSALAYQTPAGYGRNAIAA